MKTPLDFLNEVSVEKGYRSWYDVYSGRNFSDLNIIPQIAAEKYAYQLNNNTMEEKQNLYDVWQYFDTYPEFKIASNLTLEKAKELKGSKGGKLKHLTTYEIRSVE